MLHHVSRLRSTVLPFSSILQAAAARAWTRRAHSNNVHRPAKPPCLSRDTGPSSQRACRTRDDAATHVAAHSVGVCPIDPDALSEFDTNWSDPARIESLDKADPPWDVVTFVTSPPTESSPTSPMPIPTSPEALYRNLLHLTSCRPFSINAAVEYHFNYPKTYHSTRSFNLLISLAIRHTAFGTAGRLFKAMRSESVPADMETWKLSVRWLVRTGRWGEAWRRVWSIMEQNAYKADFAASSRKKSMPLPLWLEFFYSQKRGALRRWSKAPTKEPPNGNDTRVFHSSPGASTTLEESRYRALMSVFPPLTSSDCSDLSPRTVFVLARAMIQVGRRDLAFSMTSSFLRTLPPTLGRCHQRTILELIHLHMATLPGKGGLSRHFAQRRILFGFLDTHRGLRPSSATLFLLLGSLRRCRRCGTLAMECLRIFSKRWGSRVQSSMVRRRITSLALKEGRLDVAQVNVQAERNARAREAAWRIQREIFKDPGPRTLVRRPWRMIFSRRGTENRRWHLLMNKLARTQQLAKSNHFTA